MLFSQTDKNNFAQVDLNSRPAIRYGYVGNPPHLIQTNRTGGINESISQAEEQRIFSNPYKTN